MFDALQHIRPTPYAVAKIAYGLLPSDPSLGLDDVAHGWAPHLVPGQQHGADPGAKFLNVSGDFCSLPVKTDVFGYSQNDASGRCEVLAVLGIFGPRCARAQHLTMMTKTDELRRCGVESVSPGGLSAPWRPAQAAWPGHTKKPRSLAAFAARSRRSGAAPRRRARQEGTGRGAFGRPPACFASPSAPKRRGAGCQKDVRARLDSWGDEKR